MILSASRRTDIPNYYSEWFINRIREGFLYVRNPMNAHQVSKINLSPDVIDCIVFWTKNPINMLEKLEELKPYMYYFQFTLTGYGRDVEPNLPHKREVLIPTFQRLSEQIGKERVIWRYDPIFLSDRYTVEYHIKAFEEIAASLAGYTDKVVISFIDFYKKTMRNTRTLAIQQMTAQKTRTLAEKMAEIALRYLLDIETCAEKINLQEFGISKGHCIDKRLIEKLLGCELSGQKDKYQRESCGCLESVEVGTYNTCFNGCKYCYANFHETKVKENARQYDKSSPLLCGTLTQYDKITDRKIKSLKDGQFSLFRE